MARFRYSMQSLLNIKLKMETLAKQEFSAAKAACEEEEERLQGLCDRKASYEREAVRLLEGMKEDDHWCLDLQAIKDSREAIRCMEDRIADQQVRVDAAQRTLEQARVKLSNVMVERKTHETLRDKAFEQFLADEKRQESKEIDELTSYTYGQKAKGH